MAWLAVIGVIVLGYPAHGYLVTVYRLQHCAAEYGLYPSLDEAVRAGPDPNAQYYRNVKAVAIHKNARDPATPFIRTVERRYVAESHADGSRIGPGDFASTTYVHTRDGWLLYENDLWLELGGLADWMKFYRLHGEDARIDW